MFLNHPIPRSLRLLVWFLALALPAAQVIRAAAPAPSTHGSTETKLYGRVKIRGSEAPLPRDTTVVVLKPDSGEKLKEARVANSNGDYAISGVAPGTYNLLAHDGGSYQRQLLPNRKIREGDNRIDFELDHVATRKVSGMATTSKGEALAETTITFYAPECACPIVSTSTDDRGAYEVLVVPDSYRVGVLSKNVEGRAANAFVAQLILVAPEKSLSLNLNIDWRGSELSVVGNIPEPPSPSAPRQQRNEVAVTPSIGNSIVGRVGFAGGPVPGVVVTVTRDGGRSQTTTTDSNGDYRFFNLEPGSYTVAGQASTNLTGFRQMTVQVSASAAQRVDVQLQPAGTGATAQVIVTGGAAVDITGSNVSTDQFSNFPTQRTVQELYSIAPTVTRSGLRDAAGRDRDPSVAGSSGPENNYILDGVNTSDPAFGGSGANLPFEFVQEVEINTGAYGAQYGKSSGGIFNVITKSGTNEFHGDIFGYGTTKGLVRKVKNFPFTSAAFNDFSDMDLGGDLGGPIVKDKLWFFGAFNPQRRKNFYLTQTFHAPVENKVSVPFYAGKLTWALNNWNTLTASTFGDFTRVDGFLAMSELNNVNGFGDNRNAFTGRQETGGHNYAVRLNSTIKNNFIAEFSGGLHFQRANTIPTAVDERLTIDNFAVVKDSAVLSPVSTGVSCPSFGCMETGNIDFVDGRGGSLQRNFARGPGFGLYSTQNRDRYEINAHLQNIIGKHTVKWGFEWFRNKYDINTLSTGPAITYTFTPTANLAPGTAALSNTNGAANVTHRSRVTNNWLVCTIRAGAITCPSTAAVVRAQSIPAATLSALGLTVNPVATSISSAEAFGNPFLIRSTTRVRDFELVGKTHTNVESFYVQDDWKFFTNWQFNVGARWDYQQGHNNDGSASVKFNDFLDNVAPRLGIIWDFTGKGRGKLFANHAVFIEVPIPSDLNVRAAGGNIQTDKNFNVNALNAPAGSLIVPGVSTGAVNLGAHTTPIDPGLKPQSTGEASAGVEYEVVKNLTLGTRVVYRYMRNVVEDGSFDNGDTFFIFNPGRNKPGTMEAAACAGDPATGRAPRCFGRARRFYRAIEFTATKRFTDHYQFIASYVFSSLTGNYEGSFRNDSGQSDPKMTSLFDFQSLLDNTYGRLPNERSHQFKFNGSYQTPFKLFISGNFYLQSGTPFNQLIPHPVYGNNQGFAVPRGTAIVPAVTASQPEFPNIVSSVGANRTPTMSNLDLGVYYAIKLGEKRQLRLALDWFNVFNAQRAVALDQTLLINSGVSSVPAVPNTFWGAAAMVQAPSAFRFGAKFTF